MRAELCQQLWQQFSLIRRVKENDIEQALVRAEKTQCVLALHFDIAGLQRLDIGIQCSASNPIVLDHNHLGGSTRCGFEAKRTTTGKQVQTAFAFKRLAEPVEDCFPHPVRGRTQISSSRKVQQSAAPLSADDSQPIVPLRHFTVLTSVQPPP